jgi:Family of unknown function (DUF5683)
MSRLVISFSKMRSIVVAGLILLQVASANGGVMSLSKGTTRIPAFTSTPLGTSAGMTGEVHTYSLKEAMRQSLSQPVASALASDEFDTTPKVKSQSASSNDKSLIKAGLYSALIPGLGQRYVGSPTKMKIFMGLEIGVWLGYASYKVYQGWKEDDMINFAADRGNAQLANKSDEFRDLVGFYESIDQYNMVARATDFGTRPYLMDTPENHWRWQSATDQNSYRQYKNRWREAGRRAEMMVVVAVINRLVSIVDAVRDARKSNRRLDTEFSKEEKPSIQLSLDPMSRNNQVRVALTGIF